MQEGLHLEMFGVTRMSGLRPPSLRQISPVQLLQHHNRERQRFPGIFLNLGVVEIWAGNVIAFAIEGCTFWFIEVLKYKKVKLQVVKWAYLQAAPLLHSFSTGMCHSKAPRVRRRNSSFSWWFNTIFHPFTPTVQHLVTQRSVFLHIFFCFCLPPSPPRELCDICCVFTTSWESENSWEVSARLFSFTEKKSLIIWTPESPGTTRKPFPNQALLQLPGLVAFFPTSSSEICAMPGESWASHRVFQGQPFSSHLPGHEIIALPCIPLIWNATSPISGESDLTFQCRDDAVSESAPLRPDLINRALPSSPLPLRPFSLVHFLRLAPIYICLLCFSNYLEVLLGGCLKLIFSFFFFLLRNFSLICCLRDYEWQCLKERMGRRREGVQSLSWGVSSLAGGFSLANGRDTTRGWGGTLTKTWLGVKGLGSALSGTGGETVVLLVCLCRDDSLLLWSFLSFTASPYCGRASAHKSGPWTGTLNISRVLGGTLAICFGASEETQDHLHPPHLQRKHSWVLAGAQLLLPSPGCHKGHKIDREN